MPKSKKEEYLELKKPELAARAKELGLTSISRFTKEELADAIISAEKASSAKPRKAAKPKPAKPESDSKTASKKSAPKKTAAKAMQALPENGIAVQHPSASPSARQYSRLEEEESWEKPAVWPDRNSVPERYGRDRLLLFARDPRHLFCIWELSPAKLAALSRTIPAEDWNARRQVLRLFRTTAGMSKPIVTADVFGEFGRYHLEVPYANATYHIELGFYFPSGSYNCALTTQPIRSPQDAPPALAPVRWMTVTPVRVSRTLTLKTESATAGTAAPVRIRREISQAVAERRKELGIADGPALSSERQDGGKDFSQD